MDQNSSKHKEARNAYMQYWSCYLSGNRDGFADMISEDFEMIGTTSHEIAHGKSEGLDFFDTSTDELKGKTEFRNRHIELKDHGEMVLVNEFSDIYVMIDEEWKYYSGIRLSTWLQQTKGGWKIVQQHGSFPDGKASETETLGFTQISEENLQLRDAIRRNTIELEQKNKQLQFEAALEKIRANTMQMQHSNQLTDVSKIFCQQLLELGIDAAFSYVWLPDEQRVEHMFWATWENRSGNNERFSSKSIVYPLDKNEPYTAACFAAWEKDEPVQENFIQPHEVPAFFEAWHELLEGASHVHAENFPQGIYYTEAYMRYGCFGINIHRRLNPDERDIFSRFALEFERTYSRFLDLQKAEAQAREAQIEASLERVRSRTMGMQKSAELGDVAVLLYNELKSLGITQEFFETGYVEIDEVNKIQTCWTTTPSGDYLEPFNLPLTGEPVLDARYEAWKNSVPVFKQLVSGEELKKTIDFTIPYMGNKEAEEITRNLAPNSIIFYCGNFSHGYLNINSDTPLGAEAESLLARFTRVFEMTYKRFLDLKKAEFQTHQAKIETALEKVRARALAMQQPEELTEVAQVMRYEMGLLGVEELETSSIYIHEDNSHQAECWYAIKDIRVPEKKLVADHFILNLHDTWVGRQMFDFYRSTEKQISIPMQGANRKEWINYCSERSKLLDGFYGDDIPERTYHLYKFSNGTIGAATPGNISAESWDLLQRAASVFSLAYSRFKDLTQARTDLQKLKEEKQRAETALAELQTTQKQLIQAEKMASLGELTAGIAHEIQNPLNFVNNFAEVNTEMITEGKDAIKFKNWEDTEEIMNTLAENNDKILHHGKRADAIVKGMLQHSRSSSGVKEPTDINALVDEYLRLAYHGLKAKDRSFNVTLRSDFDQSIGNINIIPQDIGRVLLNLINNAFYAVKERSVKQNADYTPEVEIKTVRSGDDAIISVKDNGNGIPENIIQKIFQPFFTTKPTGEGTGLGLSLSYDIVKAHGGEIKVESTEGVGTVLTVTLSIR